VRSQSKGGRAEWAYCGALFNEPGGKNKQIPDGVARKRSGKGAVGGAKQKIGASESNIGQISLKEMRKGPSENHEERDVLGFSSGRDGIDI